MTTSSRGQGDGSGEVAVIGIALRLPGAATVAAFWDNLCAGVESITDLSLERLRAAAVPEVLLEHPAYVRRKPLLTGVADFATMDTRLFRFSPREAQLTSPEQRLLLECAWEALEDAAVGVPAAGARGGAFVSAALSTYLLKNLLPAMSARTLGTVLDQAMFGNDHDHTALRLAHRLDLTGPAFALGSTCSSSLVAVHVAAQSLLAFECDYAIAGGASVEVPHETGYLHREGGLAARDGVCRAFDARASGTVFGSGAGIVVLKRLEDARADGNPIYATIRGSAVNNDGAHKQSYTAPSLDGQAKVITEALALAGVEPTALGVVEAQGTATPLGDSIEVAALTQAFAGKSRGPGTCALGSVKTNIGHAGGAAGIAAFIKAVLMVHHGRIPPSLHFSTPNPSINFSRGPFFVNGEERPWPSTDAPRVAGVSAFGVGGTNAHVVVGEPPSQPGTSEVAAGPHRFVWSAATATALEAQRVQLRARLESTPSLDLVAVATTLQLGRRPLAVRDGFVCQSREEALRLLVDAGQRQQSQAADVDLRRWLRGETVTWTPTSPQRLRLPTYPFERQRHWIEAPRIEAPRIEAARSAHVVDASGAAGAEAGASLEAVITDAAMTVLGFYSDEISLDTDLIEWGIDSFLVAELVQTVHQRLGISIPFKVLFEQRTIRAIARAVQGAAPSAATPARFDFEWVESRDTLERIHARMLTLPTQELGSIEPLFSQGTVVPLAGLVERWQSGNLIVLCARPAGGDDIAGLYLLDRRPSLHCVGPRGLSRLDDVFVSYSYLAPEHRGSLNVALLDQWFDEQVALRWNPTPADIANTVRFVTPICHKHGRILASCLARGPHEEERLFERIYFQNFDPSDELSRLADDPRAARRLLAMMRGTDYHGISGAELLELVDAPTAKAFARLNTLIPETARPRLRDAQRRIERGELSFAGYELRWLEPLFVWRRPG